jgi:hypothetical protein
MLARQVLYHLSHTPSPFCFIRLGSLVGAQAGPDHHPPIYTFHVAGVTGAHHHAPAFIGWGLGNVLPELILNHNHLNFDSQGVRITGVSHCAWPSDTFYTLMKTRRVS